MLGGPSSPAYGVWCLHTEPKGWVQQRSGVGLLAGIVNTLFGRQSVFVT